MRSLEISMRWARNGRAERRKTVPMAKGETYLQEMYAARLSRGESWEEESQLMPPTSVGLRSWREEMRLSGGPEPDSGSEAWRGRHRTPCRMCCRQCV